MSRRTVGMSIRHTSYSYRSILEIVAFAWLMHLIMAWIWSSNWVHTEVDYLAIADITSWQDPTFKHKYFLFFYFAAVKLQLSLYLLDTEPCLYQIPRPLRASKWELSD